MRISLPLIACLLATVIPVFFGKLSVTPTWLSLQALALGWITLNKNEALDFNALEAGLEILLSQPPHGGDQADSRHQQAAPDRCLAQFGLGTVGRRTHDRGHIAHQQGATEGQHHPRQEVLAEEEGPGVGSGELQHPTSLAWSTES